MRGSATPLEVKEAFRASYLYSGNAAQSARELDIPERTGQELASALVDDPEFAEARRKLRARAVDDLVAMRMRVASKALERFEGDGDVESFTKGDNVTVIDKRADYGKLVLDAEKNAHNLARFDAEREGQIRSHGEVSINITGPGGDSSSG